MKGLLYAAAVFVVGSGMVVPLIRLETGGLDSGTAKAIFQLAMGLSVALFFIMTALLFLAQELLSPKKNE